EGPRSEGRAAHLGGQRDPHQSGRTERRDRLGRKSSFLVVLLGRRRDDAIGDLLGIQNCGLVIHDGPPHLGAYQVRKYRTRSLCDGRYATRTIGSTRLASGMPSSSHTHSEYGPVVTTFFKAILLHHLKYFL